MPKQREKMTEVHSCGSPPFSTCLGAVASFIISQGQKCHKKPCDGGSTEEREVKGMKKEMDKIQFEYRYEVQELMKVIDKYVKQNPAEKENKTLERFFDLLDVMDMEW